MRSPNRISPWPYTRADILLRMVAQTEDVIQSDLPEGSKPCPSRTETGRLDPEAFAERRSRDIGHRLPKRARTT